MQERGAWLSFASMCRNNKHSRLGSDLQILTVSVILELKEAERRLPGALTNAAELPSMQQGSRRGLSSSKCSRCAAT